MIHKWYIIWFLQIKAVFSKHYIFIILLWNYHDIMQGNILVNYCKACYIKEIFYDIYLQVTNEMLHMIYLYDN